MKLHYPGEKSRAVCGTDGLVSTTFAYRDVPFSDGSGVAKQVLVGVCDRCGEVVSIPPQSTPAIGAARDKADVSIEAMLPAMYVDALDLACYRIDPGVSRDFRKRLLMYYVHRYASGKMSPRSIAKITNNVGVALHKGAPSAVRRRLSMKVSPAMSRSVEKLLAATKLTKTELFKSLVVQIEEEIVEPRRPANLEELQALASVANC
jgi:hypothetical protein